MLRQYFNCNERLEVFLTCFCNILCHVGTSNWQRKSLYSIAVDGLLYLFMLNYTTFTTTFKKFQKIERTFFLQISEVPTQSNRKALKIRISLRELATNLFLSLSLSHMAWCLSYFHILVSLLTCIPSGALNRLTEFQECSDDCRKTLSLVHIFTDDCVPYIPKMIQVFPVFCSCFSLDSVLYPVPHTLHFYPMRPNNLIFDSLKSLPHKISRRELEKPRARVRKGIPTCQSFGRPAY